MRPLVLVFASVTLLSTQTAPYAPKQSDRPEALTVDEPGFQPIFDGKTLAGWDGHPEVWKVENGAITAENWPERRVGGTFVIWRGGEPGDFELKLEVKADYDIHSGIFYRGTVGPAPPRAGNRALTRRRILVVS